MTKLHFNTNTKYWWWNMNNIVINYLHCSEENHLYLVHMSSPKLRIDRCGGDSRVWRFC